MPAKTKKEKLLAESHRKFSFAYQPTSYSSANQIQTAALAEESHFIRRDIIKTISLGLIAIVVEIGLYVSRIF